MRKLLNTIVLYLYRSCCKYINKHMYKPKHVGNVDTEFWGNDLPDEENNLL